MRRKNRVIIFFMAMIFVALGGAAMLGCAGEYSASHNPPNAQKNAVYYIERNKLSFALGMEVDSASVIEGCNCTVIGADGEQIKVTAELLNTPDFEYENFDLDTVGYNKKITLRYYDAVNYIYYDVNEYTVNFYTAPDTLWKSTTASAALNDSMALSVWVDIARNNYSTDSIARTRDPDGARLFNGWRDSTGELITGLYTLKAPSADNRRVLDLYADYITEAQFSAMNIYYNAAGERVFGGYRGEQTELVSVPEGVTYIDFAAVFEDGFKFTKLHIPSTAALDTPFMYAVNTVGLKEITVQKGNPRYASYNGSLYSRDFRTLYFMPASAEQAELHVALNEFGSYSCAYLQLRELELPVGVNILQHYCFAYSALKNVKGLEHIKTIMAGAFYKSDLDSITDGSVQYFVRPDGKYILGLAIDKTIVNYTVLPDTVAISGDAFSGCAQLRSITFNDGLQSIGDSAFSGCVSLTEVVFPPSLAYMGGSVFYGCSSLTSARGLPDVTYRDEQGAEYEHTVPVELFYNCTALTRIEFADGTHTVGPRSLYGCTALTEAILPDSVQYIGTSSFYGSGVHSVRFPRELRGLGKNAFSHSKLSSLDFSACPELMTLSEHCFEYTQLKTVKLSDRIKTIPAYCFYYVRTLTSIDIGNATAIGERAFSYCTELTGFDFGQALERVDERAFSNCYKLNNLVFPDSVKSIGGYAFQRCDSLTDLTLGVGLESFGEYTLLSDGVTFDVSKPPFYQCYNIARITVADGNHAFKSIDGVLYGRSAGGVDYGEASVLYAVPSDYPQAVLNLPDSVRVVLPYAVEYQKRLNTVNLNDGLENIGKGAFYGSSAITTLTVPSTVTNIGASILLSCNNIESVFIATDNNTYSSDGNLIYKGSSLIMCVGSPKRITVKEGTSDIASGVFMNTAIEQAVIADSVTSIGYRAFYGCKKLKSISIGSGLSYLDPSAFAALPSLQTITVSAHNKNFSAKDNVLYGNGGKKVLLAAAQNGMTDLTGLVGVTDIGDWAFAYHATLSDCVIPEGVRFIGTYAFYECRSIYRFYGSQTLETIGERAFSFETSINPNDTAETRYHDALKTVMLHSSTISMGDYAFYGQYGLRSLYLNMSFTQAEAFIDNSGRNKSYLTHGCPKGNTGTYYNEVSRYLFSAQPPTINYDGYGWFKMNSGEPTPWSE